MMPTESDVTLIKHVEKFPYLYYKGALNHNNELLIINTWKKIGRDLKLSPVYCMQRWKYLRRRFTREPEVSHPEKEWHLMKYLRFLEPFIHRKEDTDILRQTSSISDFDSNERQTLPSRVERKASSITENENSNDTDSHSSEATSFGISPWKLSNDSFCSSLSNALQNLSADQQVSCRIDILVVIEKYMSLMNSRDGLKSTNSGSNSFHSRVDTLVSDVSKRFADIPDKIFSGSITLFDEDWLLIFAVKNFFCKLLEMRTLNAELDKMLPAFRLVDTDSQINELYFQEGEKCASQNSAEIKRSFCMNGNPELSKTVSSNIFPSSTSNPQSAGCKTVETCTIKMESCETEFDNFTNGSQFVHTLQNNGKKSNKVSVTPVSSMKIPKLCNTVVHNNATPCSNLDSQLTTSTQVKIRPIKTESNETQSGCSEHPPKNLQTISHDENSDYISLKPTLGKNNPTSAVSKKTVKNLIRIRNTSDVKSTNTSNSTADLPSLNSSCTSPSGLEVTNPVFLKAIHECLNKINSIDSTHGFVEIGQRTICVLCDVSLPSEQYKKAHINDSNHKNFTKDYFLHSSRVKKTALPKLDSTLYEVHDYGLYCISCTTLMQNRGSFWSHMKSERHKKRVKNLPRYFDIDAMTNCSIDKEIVTIGTSNYCVLCDVKLFDIPSFIHKSSGSHQKEIALLGGIFKIDRDGYCSFCNEKFPYTSLSIHVKNWKHVANVFKT